MIILSLRFRKITLDPHMRRRVTVVVCVSVRSHLTSGASVRPENSVTYSTVNGGRNICGVFSETALPPLKAGHFPTESAHAHYSSVLSGVS